MRRTTRIALGLASLAATAGLVALSTYVAGLWHSGTGTGASTAVTVREDRGPAVVAGGPAGEPAEFETVRAVGFDKAPDALQAAVDLVPFKVELPAYVPGDLALDNVVASARSQGGMQVFYDPPRNGEYQQELSILWEPFNAADAEPRQKSSSESTFAAGGRGWRYWVVNWPYYDTIEARTVTEEGMEIISWIRVIGMDHDTALGELQKVVASLTPVPKSDAVLSP